MIDHHVDVDVDVVVEDMGIIIEGTVVVTEIILIIITVAMCRMVNKN
jgi:hypothetical protein